MTHNRCTSLLATDWRRKYLQWVIVLQEECVIHLGLVTPRLWSGCGKSWCAIVRGIIWARCIWYAIPSTTLNRTGLGCQVEGWKSPSNLLATILYLFRDREVEIGWEKQWWYLSSCNIEHLTLHLKLYETTSANGHHTTFLHVLRRAWCSIIPFTKLGRSRTC